jgi:predicted PurR-regulated permease PerM
MRRNGKLARVKTFVTCLIVLFASALVYGGSLQEEFDRLCVHTQEAESLSLEKLQELVTECDQLLKKIEESNDEMKKHLLFRLNKCRNFLAYMVELKQEANLSSPQ